MRRLRSACLAASIVVSAVSPAQPLSNWSGSLYYDLRTRVTSAVVLTEIAPITLHGKQVLSLSAFAGSQVRAGATPVGGFALTRTWAIADQVGLTAGLGLSVSQGSPVGVGGIVGLSIRFGDYPITVGSRRLGRSKITSSG